MEGRHAVFLRQTRLRLIFFLHTCYSTTTSARWILRTQWKDVTPYSYGKFGLVFFLLHEVLSTMTLVRRALLDDEDTFHFAVFRHSMEGRQTVLRADSFSSAYYMRFSFRRRCPRDIFYLMPGDSFPSLPAFGTLWKDVKAL